MSYEKFIKRFCSLNQKRQIDFLLEHLRMMEISWNIDKKRNYHIEIIIAALNTPEGKALAENLSEIGKLEKKLLSPSLDLSQVLPIIVPIERQFQHFYKDHDFLVHDKDRPVAHKKNNQPVVIVLENIRSAFNIGSIFRTAECLGAQKIFLCGYSATPEHKIVEKTALGSSLHIPWTKYHSIDDAIFELKENGYSLVGLETTSHAQSLFAFHFPKPCALFMGNERFGLNSKTLDELDYIVKIPTYGIKNSLNVSNACAIAGYELMRQWQSEVAF